MRIHGEPNQELKDVWVYLTSEEADEVLLALEVWAEEVTEGRKDPGWHMHVTDEGRELTIAIDDDAARGRFLNPS